MFGQCARFDRARGFGFIIPTDDPTLPDIFVHFSAIEHNEVWRRRFLLPGMRVQFDIEPEESNPDRFRATHVRVVAPVTIAVQRSLPKPGRRS